MEINQELEMLRMMQQARKMRAAQYDARRAALDTAIEQGDADTAAEMARLIRNQMLKDSDAEMALDRLGLTMPTGSTFTAWLGWLKTLAGALGGGMAQYRQALRDITKQEGFPMAIQWPVNPNAEDEGDGSGDE